MALSPKPLPIRAHSMARQSGKRHRGSVQRLTRASDHPKGEPYRATIRALAHLPRPIPAMPFARHCLSVSAFGCRRRATSEPKTQHRSRAMGQSCLGFLRRPEHPHQAQLRVFDRPTNRPIGSIAKTARPSMCHGAWPPKRPPIGCRPVAHNLPPAPA